MTVALVARPNSSLCLELQAIIIIAGWRAVLNKSANTYMIELAM